MNDYVIPQEPRNSYWEIDTLFRDWVEKQLPEPARAFAKPRLSELGQVAAETIAPLAAIADRESPRLVDGTIEYHESYRQMERIAYGSGFIALKYDPAIRAEYAGDLQKIGFALGYLFGQAEMGLFCPACMTDGVARVLVAAGDRSLIDQWVPKLCFTRLENRTTGAMFLSERQGGSDVGTGVVRAESGHDHVWRLTGEKYFCSNADAEVALVLARPVGAQAGTRGLGLFLMPREWDGVRQPGIRIRKLKDKLGVRSMPTAEIELEGARAYPVGALNQGFKQMVEMVNYSRLYNAVGAAAVIARACYEAEAWANARQAFGHAVVEHPLARATLRALRAEHAGALALTFEAVAVLDRVDTGDVAARPLYRALTPLAKYHTAKAAVACCSEAMEVIGGNAYMEDRVMPRLLRDAQVLPIWEGTTNIQILDAVRGARSEGTGEALSARLVQALDTAATVPDGLAKRVSEVNTGYREIAGSHEPPHANTKTFFDRTVRTVQCALLCELGWTDAAKQLLDGHTLIA